MKLLMNNQAQALILICVYFIYLVLSSVELISLELIPISLVVLVNLTISMLYFYLSLQNLEKYKSIHNFALNLIFIQSILLVFTLFIYQRGTLLS